MPTSTGEGTATHYLVAHGRIAALVNTLTDEQLGTSVPSTPGWTVHDVLAHLVAIPTDGMAGRITGIPTEEFTARQIAERRDRTATQLLDEWRPNVEPMCEGARVDLVPPSSPSMPSRTSKTFVVPSDCRPCSTRRSSGSARPSMQPVAGSQ